MVCDFETTCLNVEEARPRCNSPARSAITATSAVFLYIYSQQPLIDILLKEHDLVARPELRALVMVISLRHAVIISA